MSSNPFISFVVAARNDNYGGSLLHRMQVSLNVLLTLCENHSLDMELIIVEWNPPSNAPKLAKVLAWPKNLKFQEVRFIEVPGEIHRKLPNSEKMPMFEYIAKNAGIRRAKGEYVLATNADDIFSRELIQFLALKELSPECFYRTDTYNVKESIPLDSSIEEQLNFCAKYWIKVKTVRGLRKRYNPLLDYQYLRSLIKWLGGKLISHPRAGIHTNAAGDFFLMHRKHWHNLLGYPELPTRSFIDGYMCFMAASSGLSQIILNGKKRIYHQEHIRPGRGTLPKTDFRLYLKHAKQMMQSRQPLITNDEKWGLGEENLPETSIPLK